MQRRAQAVSPEHHQIQFAAECIELAQTSSSPEKRTLYLKMASVWHEMAQRWEKKTLAGAAISGQAADEG